MASRAESQGLAGLRLAWVAYCAAVLSITLGTLVLDAGVLASGRVVWYVMLHGALLGAACVLPTAGHRGRVAWSILVAVALPAVFSAVGLVLPALHPQPYEWFCIAADRWLFGTDPTVAVQAWLAPWLVEVLQLGYATFYFLPVAVLIALLRRGRCVEYDACLCTVAVGFLLSYLGYYLFPTLPPYRYLEHGGPLVGLGLAERVHAVLDALEANRFDCMPSGHTMLTLMTLVLARRYTPRLFLVLVPMGLAIVVATVALRYHYVVDVWAGAVAAPVGLWAGRAVQGARPRGAMNGA